MAIASRALPQVVGMGPALILVGLLIFLGCGASDPIQQVRELQNRGELQASLEPLRELLATRPDDPEVQFRYGTALSQLGEVSMAQWALMRAMESPKWTERAAFALAEVALATRNWPQAIEALNTVLESDPDHVSALVMRAGIFVQSRTQYEEALGDTDRVLELDPENIIILPVRLVALLGLERSEEAETALSDLLEQRREESDFEQEPAFYCAVLALFAVEARQLEQAEERYEGCLAEFPEDDEVIRGAVSFFDQTQREDRSIEILRTSLEARPTMNSYRSDLARRLEKMGNKEEALALLKEGTEQVEDPSLQSAAWLSVGQFHLEAGNYAEATQAIEAVLEILPDPPPQLIAYYSEGLLLSGRYDEALEVADTMTVPVHQALVRGRAALAMGRPAEALAFFDEGLKLWPDNAVARYYAARSAEQTGNFDRAIEAYRYAVRADPEGTDAKLRLARLLFAQGDNQMVAAAVAHTGKAVPATEHPAALLLGVEALARAGRLNEAQRLANMLSSNPEFSSPALAALIRGISAQSGPEAALEFMDRVKNFDATAPVSEPVSRELVVLYVNTGQREKAIEIAQSAAETNPGVAPLLALHGLAFELAEAPEGKARSRYEQALSIDPESQAALHGLARLDAGRGDLETALERIDRAIAVASTPDPELARRRAFWLEQSGRPEDASQQLSELLDEFPADAAAALQLAKLRLKYASDREQAARLARRSARFGGGAEAQALADALEDSPAGGPEPETH